eukprot:SAG22_NODE_9155_length_607_cov_0.809055_2_plen_49_part_00
MGLLEPDNLLEDGLEDDVDHHDRHRRDHRDLGVRGLVEPVGPHRKALS